MTRKDRADELLVQIGRALYYLDRHIETALDLELRDVLSELEQAYMHLGQAKANLHDVGAVRRPAITGARHQKRPDDPRR